MKRAEEAEGKRRSWRVEQADEDGWLPCGETYPTSPASALI